MPATRRARCGPRNGRRGKINHVEFDDPAHVRALAALIRPVEVLDFISGICRWLQDAHDAAADLQPLRKNTYRGNWNNNTSFGTDRHQYLLATASSLTVDFPDLDVDSAFQSVLLKLDHVGVYQFHVDSPFGSLSDSSELRRELLAPGDDIALLSRRDAWLTGRELLLLPWSGTEELGLTDAWAGQGTMYDNRMRWDWLVRLQDVAASQAPLAPMLPLDPEAFDQPQPELPLRPRTERPSGSTD